MKILKNDRIGAFVGKQIVNRDRPIYFFQLFGDRVFLLVANYFRGVGVILLENLDYNRDAIVSAPAPINDRIGAFIYL